MGKENGHLDVIGVKIAYKRGAPINPCNSCPKTPLDCDLDRDPEGGNRKELSGLSHDPSTGNAICLKTRQPITIINNPIS